MRSRLVLVHQLFSPPQLHYRDGWRDRLVEQEEVSELDEGFFSHISLGEEDNDKLFAEAVSIRMYFSVPDWLNTKSYLADVVERTIREPKCLYQGWSRSGDLLMIREAFTGSAAVANHWARVNFIFEQLAMTGLCMIDRIEIHGLPQIVEEAAQQVEVELNFAHFERLPEALGAVFARRTGGLLAAKNNYGSQHESHLIGNRQAALQNALEKYRHRHWADLTPAIESSIPMFPNQPPRPVL